MFNRGKSFTFRKSKFIIFAIAIGVFNMEGHVVNHLEPIHDDSEEPFIFSPQKVVEPVLLLYTAISPGALYWWSLAIKTQFPLPNS